MEYDPFCMAQVPLSSMESGKMDLELKESHILKVTEKLWLWYKIWILNIISEKIFSLKKCVDSGLQYLYQVNGKLYWSKEPLNSREEANTIAWKSVNLLVPQLPNL